MQQVVQEVSSEQIAQYVKQYGKNPFTEHQPPNYILERRFSDGRPVRIQFNPGAEIGTVPTWPRENRYLFIQVEPTSIDQIGYETKEFSCTPDGSLEEGLKGKIDSLTLLSMRSDMELQHIGVKDLGVAQFFYDDVLNQIHQLLFHS